MGTGTGMGDAGHRSGGWDETVAEHRQRQLLRIGRAAADLVTKDGLSRVSMSQLARAAGVSRATLYNYVPDVATAIRLYLATQTEAFHVAVAAAVAEEPDPQAQLRRYIREQVAYVAGADHRAAVAIADAGLALGGSASPAAHRQRNPSVLDDILDRGVREGAFRPADRDVRAILIDRLLYCTHALIHEQGLTHAEATGVITELVLDGIRAHTDPPGG